MRKLHYPLLLIGMLFMLSSTNCKKTGGGSNGEANLVVETSPAGNGHLEAPAPGPNFPLKVTITSAMPAAGVKIDITAKPDGGTTPFYTASQNSTAAVNDFSITGTTANVVSVVNITVTSLSKSSNTWTGSYKYSRK